MLNFDKWMGAYPVENKIYIDDIEWKCGGLLINLEDDSPESKKYKLLFEGIIYSYKWSNEFYKPSVWLSDGTKYYPFFYSFDTNDISLFKKECVHVVDDKIIHFVIVGLDSVVEVFTSEFPKLQ